MIESKFNGIEIAGVSAAVPKKREDVLKKYSAVFGEDAVKQFIQTTGVRERRVAGKNQTSSDLAFVSARCLLDQTGIDKNEVGVLIFVTQTPDYKMPSTACVLHQRLNLGKDCIAYDINLGCSGYVYGLQTICALMQSIGCKHGLLLVGDTSSKYVSPEDRSSVMLFGDSGSATLLAKSGGNALIQTACRTNGHGFQSIIIPAGGYRKERSFEGTVTDPDGNRRSEYDLHMNGIDVFSFAISEVPKMVNEFMEENNANPDEYDDFIFHQANLYILKQIAKKCWLDDQKIHVSLDRYGNTSVTSIPLTLCDKYGGMDGMKQKKIFACGYGVGLSWGLTVLDVGVDRVFPIIETDESYDDGHMDFAR